MGEFNLKTRVVIGKLRKAWSEPFLPAFVCNFDELIIKYYNSPLRQGKDIFFPSCEEIKTNKRVEFWDGYYFGLFFFSGAENIEDLAKEILVKRGFDVSKEL